jgi:hypothetical protein
MDAQTGERFGRWVVVGEAESVAYRNGQDVRKRVVCQCDCGIERVVHVLSLRAGRSTSCGCRRDENALRTNTKHGHAAAMSPMYRRWQAIKSRCRNPNHSAYVRYGGRGVMVCDRWADDFCAFLEDVMLEIGDPPPGHSLDRIDNVRGYEPGNVRWATPKEQQRNMRTNRVIEIDGDVRTLAEWAEVSGNLGEVIRSRLARGIEPRRAVFDPPMTRRERARRRRTNRIIEIDGEARCLADWAEVSGTHRATIGGRLRRGWSAKEAVYGRSE